MKQRYEKPAIYGLGASQDAKGVACNPTGSAPTGGDNCTNGTTPTLIGCANGGTPVIPEGLCSVGTTQTVCGVGTTG